MPEKMHPVFVRHLEARSEALLRRESLLVRLEAKLSAATIANPIKGRKKS